MNKTIVIFGTSRAKHGDGVYELAYNLGKLLAKANYEIANGGYGGTMEAAAKAANHAGAKTIGVTCSAFGRNAANQYISKELPTTSLDKRLKKLIDTGQAYIILPGGTGTLLELAMVWELKNKGFINRDKPIILLGSFWPGLLKMIEKDDPDSINCIDTAETPEQVIEILKRKI